jgi:uncharacterized membrane protein YczE
VKKTEVLNSPIFIENKILSRSRVHIFLLRYVYFFAGLFISCIGNYFLIAAQNLGVSPWDVFHLGILRYVPIELGTIGIITGMLVLIPSSLMGIKPSIGTFLNIYFYGIIFNILMSSHLLERPQSALLSLVYLILGIFISGFGTALYLLGNVGAGPRDGLMLGLNQKTRFSIAQVRTGIEITVVILGFLMGGPLGIGTLIFSLSIGISVQWAMKFLERLKLDEEVLKASEGSEKEVNCTP